MKSLVSSRTGGAQQHINKNDIENMKFVLPHKEVMCSFNVSVSVFTYCHKKLSKGGGLLSVVSLLWMVANSQVIDSCISPMAY